jgi:D-alanyl-lipoteichoic acid acyltransferase DltB (MBOAT superfamily)
VRHYRNLIITMTLCGLWHGAAWTFVLWGVLHALGLVIQQLVRPLTARLPDAGPRSWPWKLLGWFVAFHLWCLFFVPFRAVDIAHAGELARILWTDRSIGMAGAWLVPALVYVAPLIVVEAFQLAATTRPSCASRSRCALPCMPSCSPRSSC